MQASMQRSWHGSRDCALGLCSGVEAGCTGAWMGICRDRCNPNQQRCDCISRLLRLVMVGNERHVGSGTAQVSRGTDTSL